MKGQVATLTVANVESLPKPGERPPDAHWELAQVFGELRGDNRVRVIVLTGPGNGIFHAGLRGRYGTPSPRDQGNEWLNFTGCRRVHQEMAESENNIVVRNAASIGRGVCGFHRRCENKIARGKMGVLKVTRMDLRILLPLLH